MEDLWKLTSIDYRLSPFVAHKVYDEIISRYHAAEEGRVNLPLISDKDLCELLPKE